MHGKGVELGLNHPIVIILYNLKFYFLVYKTLKLIITYSYNLKPKPIYYNTTNPNLVI